MLCATCSEKIKKRDDYVSHIIVPRNDEPDCRYHVHLYCFTASIKHSESNAGNNKTANNRRNKSSSSKGDNTAEFDTKDLDDPWMPFGKFGPKGDEGPCRISDLPDSYLLWLLEKADSDILSPSWLNKVIKDEWKRRGI